MRNDKINMYLVKGSGIGLIFILSLAYFSCEINNIAVKASFAEKCGLLWNQLQAASWGKLLLDFPNASLFGRWWWGTSWQSEADVIRIQFIPFSSSLILQHKAALLWTVGRHKASLSRFTPRSSRGERGICPFSGKTHCLLCCPYSSLSVVKFLARLFHHPQPVPLSPAGAVPEFRLQHCHICHMVLRLSCFFLPVFQR